MSTYRATVAHVDAHGVHVTIPKVSRATVFGPLPTLVAGLVDGDPVVVTELTGSTYVVLGRVGGLPVAAPTWESYVTGLDLYAWWRLDEDVLAVEGDKVAEDATGHGRHGVYAGDSTSPDRPVAPIAAGSVSAVTSAGPASNLRDNSPEFADELLAGSFTFGCCISSEIVGAGFILARATVGFTGLEVLLNWPTAGDLRFYFDTGGSDGDALSAVGTGWNDGTPHLLMWGYDEDADSMSIWLDGAPIAVRARAGTRPVEVGQHDWLGVFTGGGTGVTIDEYLFADRALTALEHATLDELRRL